MILMIYRVDFDGFKINEIYYQRNLVINITELIKILDEFLNSGFKFGTIDQGIESNNFLHISFDDGYKEHLIVVKKIKKEFGLQKNNCSFAINIGNSLLSDFSGMDLIYDIIQNNSLKELCNYLSINLKKCTHKGKIYQNECL